MDNSHNNIHTVASNKNLGPVFLGVDWAVFSLSSIAVLIRLFTRAWVTRNFGWDDAVMALTQVKDQHRVSANWTYTENKM